MRYTLVKVGLLAGCIGLWGMTLYVYWGKVWIRTLCLAIAIGVGAILIWPGHKVNKSNLRKAYVNALMPYLGTSYLWGGGNRIGIDCSGLVQRGLIDAECKQAITTHNPALLREGLALWWHSCSARALGEGYRNETRLLLEANSLNTANYTQIEPGDIAVMSDGVHTLAYVGRQTWIEADPKPMHVVLAKAPGNTDTYFNEPVHIMRWRVIDKE